MATTLELEHNIRIISDINYVALNESDVSQKESNVENVSSSRLNVKYFSGIENTIDPKLYNTVAIHFTLTKFLIEVIYQLLHYFAVPIIFLSEGCAQGYITCKGHGFLPNCLPAHPSTPAGHILWLGFVISNILWVINDFELKWGFEVLFINLQMSFRIFVCALKYGYLTSTDIQNNLSKEPLHTNAIMLVFGWGFYNTDALKQQHYATKIRLGWRKNAKLKVISKKYGNIAIDMDNFIDDAIDVTSKPNKAFIVLFICCGVVSAMIVAVDYLLSDYDSHIDIVFFVAWAFGVLPVALANFAYLSVAFLDFIRLNQLLVLTSIFLLPLHERHLFYLNGTKMKGFYREATKKLTVQHDENSKQIKFENNDLIIDVEDIESLYNWLNMRHYFLEFGQGFRQRELIIVGVILAAWTVVGLYALYETVFRRDFEVKHYIIIGIAWFALMIPTLLIVLTASKIQKNFKKEIEILEERKLKVHFDAVAACCDEIQMDNKASCDDIRYYKHHLRTIALESVVNTLKNDDEKYSFKVFGIRIDQGLITFLIPLVFVLLKLGYKI